MSLLVKTSSRALISDSTEQLTWTQLLELAHEAPQGVHFLSGGNSVSQAALILAAALGRCSIIPLSPRLKIADREDIHNLFDQISPPTGIFIATSGSQGKPKLVHLSPELLSRHAHAVNQHVHLTENDTWLACLPFFHVGGMAIVLRCALAGAGVRILDNSSAELVAKNLDTVSLLSLVPTTLRRVLTLRNDILPDSIRAIILGGGPVPVDMIRQCPQVLPTYGLTEAGSMVTCSRPGCDDSERLTAGPPIPGAAVKIVDENGTPVPVNTSGRILVQSPGAASAYFRNDNETALTFREGWIFTEDSGFLDELGCLHVLGRIDRIIVSGGENIALDEIESALRLLPDVRDALCVGIEDSEWGQSVAAVIESDLPLTLEHVREQLKAHLPSFKLPKQVSVTFKLPLLPNGKPDYRTARNLFG